MKKVLSVVIAAVLVFSLGVFCVSANEENGYDNFLDSYLNAMVILTAESDAEIENWDDVLEAASDSIATSAGDEAEDFALALDGLNESLSELSNEEFEAWDDAIVYGSEQIYTDFAIDSVGLYDAFVNAATTAGLGVGEDSISFVQSVSGASVAVGSSFKLNIDEFITSIVTIFNRIADYIEELTGTLNWYAAL